MEFYFLGQLLKLDDFQGETLDYPAVHSWDKAPWEKNT